MTSLGWALNWRAHAKPGIQPVLQPVVQPAAPRTTLPERRDAKPATDTDTTTDAASAPAGSVVFEGVAKRYRTAAGEVPALSDIHLSVRAGSICGIIGRSGAGKSSLLRTINRLESPTEGRVRVDGEDIASLNEDQLVALRRRVGMIFQHFNLLSAKTVFENVALPLRVAGVPAAEIPKRVTELLSLVGLEGKHQAYPSRLSGGQKQRVGIARALVHHPRILLCDEATSALDPETTGAILALLRDINRQLGLTVVLITHEMDVIREICDDVAVLEKGRLVETGPVWQVFGAPQHDATRALLRPLDHGLPDDLQRALQAQPAGIDGPTGTTGTAGTAGLTHERVLELAFTGEGGLEPDFARISAALGGPIRLLHGGVDRIQGHTHGHLVLAAPPVGPAVAELVAQGICHAGKELGYVAHHA